MTRGEGSSNNPITFNDNKEEEPKVPALFGIQCCVHSLDQRLKEAKCECHKEALVGAMGEALITLIGDNVEDDKASSQDEARVEQPVEEMSDVSYVMPPVASSPPLLSVVAGPSHAAPGSHQVESQGTLVKIESDEEDVEFRDERDIDMVCQHEEEALAEAMANINLDREYDEVMAVRNLELEFNYQYFLEREIASAKRQGRKPFEGWI